MKTKELNTLSVSNLILIILNNEIDDDIRTYAEIELRKRIRNVGWDYNDLLHFDDKVIKERGLEVENYLFSPKVNMQQLMETYFMYDHNATYENNYLLFSEKHMCNELDFGEPFFRKICSIEIDNLDKRIKKNNDEKILLLSVKEMLLTRQKDATDALVDTFKDNPIDLLCSNEAMYQLDGDIYKCHKLYNNLSDEEKYKILKSNYRRIKTSLLQLINDTLLDTDLFQNWYGLRFVKKDSSTLNKQKNKLLKQAINGYEVDYQSETMQKALKRK